MNTKAQNPKHVFGPVPSRRLGRSLGVDLVPFKTCTYDCIYFKEKIKFQNMANVEVTFPVIADIKMDVARLYGMVQPNSSDSQAVRAVFFIDPKAKIRSVLFYPSSTGRNFHELKRLLIAMQTSDAHGCATPADWQPGQDVIVPPPGSCGVAKERVEKPTADCYALDWFMTFKKLPKEKLNLPAAAKG